MSDHTFDRDAAIGASAPWIEPEIGVRLTEEAREYERRLCEKESRKTAGGFAATFRELLSRGGVHFGRSPVDTRGDVGELIEIPGRGVFRRIYVTDHPGRAGIKTIVLIRWKLHWNPPSDDYTATCEFYAPRQLTMRECALFRASDSPPSQEPFDEFETAMQERRVAFPRDAISDFGPKAATVDLLLAVCNEVGAAHGFTAKFAARELVRPIFRKLGVER